MTVNWAESELATVSSGDKRLDKRVKRVLQAAAEAPGLAFTQLFQAGAEVKACYRLFDSDLISADTLLEPHYESSIKRIEKCNTVVIASDSSSANYTSRGSNPDSGYISSNNAQGFMIHASLATTLDRRPLGVVEARFWARAKEKPAKRTHRDYLPIEEKESYKWLLSYRLARQVARSCPKTKVINVADREADLLELWEEAAKARTEDEFAHLVVRASHNRRVTPKVENSNTKLFSYAANAPVMGRCEFDLRDRSTGSVKRRVVQEIRAQEVLISPAPRSGVPHRQVAVNVVYLQEIESPSDESPICWCLLTTLPVETDDQVQLVVNAYLSRWDIETLFRTFKSGCHVEKRALRTSGRLYPMFALFLVVAWRINSLTRTRDLDRELPCTVCFSDTEWKAAVAAITKDPTPPKEPPTMGEIIVMIARLGGYLNRRNDPPPGATVLWRGLEYLRSFADAWQIFMGGGDAQSR